jgi:hydroxymethylbilane synthase
MTVQAKEKLRLGTRPSLLAVAQSRQIANELERIHPSLEVEIITLNTRGDKDQLTPLMNVQDPDFFSAELDSALLNGSIDFCVHSFKDLDEQRPAGISTAAIPPRENPRDVIVFRGDIEELLAQGQRLHIGSSSLRRQINTGDFLSVALPNCGSQPELDFQPLRGAVHERLQRITPQAGAARLDGVILALAGLNRLWQDPQGRSAIEDVLNQSRWMVLPLDACPTAPGQGALNIECRHNDKNTHALLSGLHHASTAELVSTELRLLKENADEPVVAGIGVTAVANSELHYAAFLRGAADKDQPRKQLKLSGGMHRPMRAGKAWQDTHWREQNAVVPLQNTLPESTAVFIAHWQACIHLPAANQGTHYWTSGTRSWEKLASAGIWIEGCAENLGFDSVRPTLECPVLQLPEMHDWLAVTHEDALSSWEDSGIGRAVASYRSVVPETATLQLAQEMSDCTHFYWSSARQFQRLQKHIPAGAEHACGAGKTLQALRSAGMDPQPFISRGEWQQWLD